MGATRGGGCGFHAENPKLRVLAQSSAEFLEDCATSSSDTLGFVSLFGFTHFFHDSILNDNLK